MSEKAEDTVEDFTEFTKEEKRAGWFVGIFAFIGCGWIIGVMIGVLVALLFIWTGPFAYVFGAIGFLAGMIAVPIMAGQKVAEDARKKRLEKMANEAIIRREKENNDNG